MFRQTFPYSINDNELLDYAIEFRDQFDCDPDYFIIHTSNLKMVFEWQMKSDNWINEGFNSPIHLLLTEEVDSSTITLEGSYDW